MKRGEMLTIAVPLEDRDLKKAIELLQNSHYAALCLANALAGYVTPAWTAAHQHSLEVLKAEAVKRGLK